MKMELGLVSSGSIVVEKVYSQRRKSFLLHLRYFSASKDDVRRFFIPQFKVVANVELRHHQSMTCLHRENVHESQSVAVFVDRVGHGATLGYRAEQAGHDRRE